MKTVEEKPDDSVEREAFENKAAPEPEKQSEEAAPETNEEESHEFERKSEAEENFDSHEEKLSESVHITDDQDGLAKVMDRINSASE